MADKNTGVFTVLRGARVFAPADLGKVDVLFAGERVLAVGDGLAAQAPAGWPAVEEVDLSGLWLIPGLVDPHEHFTGGGGEGGPVTRTPEVTLTMLTMSGVTTAVGCLGTDAVTRSMEALLAKATALEAEGITTRIWTGAYQVPPPTLTGSVRSDIVLIDKVIGAGEIALSDHRSSQPTVEDLRRLAAECRVGGMLGGKPGLLHLHMGGAQRGLAPVLEIIGEGEIPASQFYPTHCSRNSALVDQAARLTQMGGRADFTAGVSAAGRIGECLSRGADVARISISSDGGGSLPRFDERGRLMGLGVGSPVTLLATVRDLVKRDILDIPTAVSLATAHPAEAIGLGTRKGGLSAGADADAVAVDEAFNVKYVWARGRLMVADGKPVVSGTFERPVK